ncbi:MAG TPA: hypothetical protein VJL34_12330 [Anaerolineales bacterium]|nr:hypothetical protein [Anaerolineales bacterium]
MTHYISYHQTITSRILNKQMDGWEFSCQYCGYKSRFFIDGGEHKFVILNHGDVNARHTSSPVQEELFLGTATGMEANQEFAHRNFFDSDHEVKLPPDLERQLNEILKRLNFDDKPNYR